MNHYGATSIMLIELLLETLANGNSYRATNNEPNTMLATAVREGLMVPLAFLRQHPVVYKVTYEGKGYIEGLRRVFNE